MLAELITIGDEILIGQIVDTNSAWMGQQLNLCGITVQQITSISDSRSAILTALKEAEQRADLILVTGGLGPTNDDITKQTLCDYFGVKLRFDPSAFADIEALFKKYNFELSPINRAQADVPENCIVLRNKNGTAPGMWFEEHGKVIVSMPGVPFEMKELMKNEVLPRLKQQFKLPFILHKTVLTQGIGESFLAEKIENWERSLNAENIKLAYLPNAWSVKLRLSTKGPNEAQLKECIDRKIEELIPLIRDYIYGFENFGESNKGHEHIAGQLLRAAGKTVATAESCTGGAIAHLITRVPGSSDYFQGSVIAYANEIKIKELGVKTESIAQFGAVSREVVEQMARGVLLKFNTDYAVADSGIAGPGGGTPEKPVGTIWIAVASKNGVVSEKLSLGQHRESNIEKTSQLALSLLCKILQQRP